MSSVRIHFDLLDDDDEYGRIDTTDRDQATATESNDQSSDVNIEVPEWKMHEVIDWITRIGYSEFVDRFRDKGVDGDLLLSLSENNLRTSIGIESSLLLQRFMREVTNLKRLASFSSQDRTNLRSFLMAIDPKFSEYTYTMLKAGVDRSCITSLSEYQLTHECRITNSIHRRKILDAINGKSFFLVDSYILDLYVKPFYLNGVEEKQLMKEPSWNENVDDKLDGFISYRRSNGSELASLLHFKLEHLGHSIFLDTERLGPGKFDNNLKQNIRRARNFLLVLTPNSLDRCIGDDGCHDWVHKVKNTALCKSGYS